MSILALVICLAGVALNARMGNVAATIWAVTAAMQAANLLLLRSA